MQNKEHNEIDRSLTTSFVAGAIAGLLVDVALFPLDTLKTRLQCQYGFWKSGGFKGIYRGIGPVAIASAPSAAVFFTTYNGLKSYLIPQVTSNDVVKVHVFSGGVGEIASLLVRVPSEIIKQRRQACVTKDSAWGIFTTILKREGIIGMYQGFWSTVARDVPFAIAQYPLWEYFKKKVVEYQLGEPCTPAQGAFCGAVGGVISGAITTPLDVVKTRLMLTVGPCKFDGTHQRVKVMPIIRGIYAEKGLLGFMAGFTPRVVWIFLGGFVFFGAYEQTCYIIDGY